VPKYVYLVINFENWVYNKKKTFLDCGNLALFCDFDFRMAVMSLPRAACASLLIKVQRRAVVPRCFKYWWLSSCVAICPFVCA